MAPDFCGAGRSRTHTPLISQTRARHSTITRVLAVSVKEARCLPGSLDAAVVCDSANQSRATQRWGRGYAQLNRLAAASFDPSVCGFRVQGVAQPGPVPWADSTT